MVRVAERMGGRKVDSKVTVGRRWGGFIEGGYVVFCHRLKQGG